MNVAGVNSISFNGTLDLRGNHYVTNRKKETISVPCRKIIDVNDINSIDMLEDSIVINYADKYKKGDYKYENLYLPLDYKKCKISGNAEDLTYFNTVLNSYIAAKQGDVHIFVPEFDESI